MHIAFKMHSCLFGFLFLPLLYIYAQLSKTQWWWESRIVIYTLCNAIQYTLYIYIYIDLSQISSQFPRATKTAAQMFCGPLFFKIQCMRTVLLGLNFQFIIVILSGTRIKYIHKAWPIMKICGSILVLVFPHTLIFLLLFGTFFFIVFSWLLLLRLGSNFYADDKNQKNIKFIRIFLNKVHVSQ